MAPESDVRMPLTAHLEELRTRLVRALVAVAVGAIACWLVIEHLIAFLLAPLERLRPAESLVIGTGLTEAFFTKLKVAVIGGIFVAAPVVFYQAWRFVAPGLYDRERRVALPFSLAASFFFVAGAAFCYWLVFPVAFQFFLKEYGTIGVEPALRISEYLTFASRMLLAFGVTFELPVATFFLARVSLVTHRTLIEWWRYAVVGIFVAAAVLTPGPDMASQFLMAAPLLALYLLSIGVAFVVGRPAVAERETSAEPA